MALDPRLVAVLACPVDKGPLYYLGDDSAAHRCDPRASPAFALDLHLLPPTLLVTAAFDPLRDEGEAFAGTLNLAGVNVRTMRVAGLPHGYAHMTTIVPSAMLAVGDTARKFRALVDDVSTRTTARSSAD